MHDVCVPPRAGTTIIFKHNMYTYKTRRNTISSFMKVGTLAPVTQTCLPFAAEGISSLSSRHCRNNNSVTSVWRDRDTSHRERKNWNTIAIDPTSITRIKKRLDITARRARNAKAKLPVTPAIPWMYRRQGKVSPSKLYSVNFI